MEAWLQSSDLSSKDMVLDLNTAWDALASHDWSSEEFKMKELDREGKDNCPAGLGLVSDKGHILHVCPGSEETIIHYHYPSQVLGFLWNSIKINTIVVSSLDDSKKYLSAFFDANWGILKNAT